MSLPRIAITIGDPSGIGPEVVRKAVRSGFLRRWCRPVVIGSRAVFGAGNPYCDFVDIGDAASEKIVPGRPSAASGRAAYRYIAEAVELVQTRAADALVTAPISKAAFDLAGIRYAGHTELLADLSHAKSVAMLMVAEKLRTVMVTRHLPLSAVSSHLSKNEIKRTTLLADSWLKKQCGIKTPRLAVCALNPHAGESGLLGTEERSVILPAIKVLKKSGLAVDGPLPIDAAWRKMHEGEFDLLVTMYHDQAMIGLKCLAPEKIVNVTAGLPFVRTSPGHGTACDIAGKNIADPRPMIEAIRVAAALTKK